MKAVSMTELEAIHGTGNEGRVTKKDILQYVTDRNEEPAKLHVPNLAGGERIRAYLSEPTVTSNRNKIRRNMFMVVMLRSLKWIACASLLRIIWCEASKPVRM